MLRKLIYIQFYVCNVEQHPPLQQLSLLSICENRALACTLIASFILHLYLPHVVHLKRCCILQTTSTIRSRVSYVCNMKMILIGFDTHFWVPTGIVICIRLRTVAANQYAEYIAFENGSCCCGLWKNKRECNKQAIVQLSLPAYLFANYIVERCVWNMNLFVIHYVCLFVCAIVDVK